MGELALQADRRIAFRSAGGDSVSQAVVSESEPQGLMPSQTWLAGIRPGMDPSIGRSTVLSLRQSSGRYDQTAALEGDIRVHDLHAHPVRLA